MKRRLVAPDGSCLFSSIDYLVSGEERDVAPVLRELCVTRYLASPDIYTIDLLGEDKSSVAEYCEWIKSPHVYGGGNEIAILSQELNVKIAVMSCIPFTTACLLARYEPNAGSVGIIGTVYLLYNGQHYDAMVGEDDQRIFAGDAATDAEALACARQIKEDRELDLRTRVRKRLKCSCGAICDTADAWQVHCNVHADDSDFDWLCEEITVNEVVATVTDD